MEAGMGTGCLVEGCALCRIGCQETSREGELYDVAAETSGRTQDQLLRAAYLASMSGTASSFFRDHIWQATLRVSAAAFPPGSAPKVPPDAF